MVYQIRLKGHLGSQWTDWFGGLTITLEEDGDTLLTGPVVDQAALYGLLKKVRDLGMPLVSVNCVEPGSANTIRRQGMNTYRSNAIIAGVLYIIGTVAGILSLVLSAACPRCSGLAYQRCCKCRPGDRRNALRVADGPVARHGSGRAVPHPEKYNEVLALGYVVFRGALETVTYFVTAIGWLLLLALSQLYVQAGAPAASSFQASGALLLKAGELSSLTGIVFCLGALMFYAVLYQSRLVPRWISVWGLAALVPYLAAEFLAMFALLDPLSSTAVLLHIPLAVQEMVLAVWFIVKGFSPSALAAGSARTDTKELSKGSTD